MLFTQFLDEIYLPVSLPKLAASTQNRTRGVIANYLRRSFATWLKMAGADVKDAQGLMRHARASTTLDVYQQFVPASQRRVIDGLIDHFAAESAP